MLADAPWIRQAILYGPDSDLPEVDPTCPCCGKRCEHIFLLACDPIGCEECIETVDAQDWAEEEFRKQQLSDIETELERRAI